MLSMLVPASNASPESRTSRKSLDLWRQCLLTAQSSERALEGRFGPYGGRYVPETLVAALDELTALYDAAKADPAFWAELDALLTEFVGRPSPLSEAPRFSELA